MYTNTLIHTMQKNKPSEKKIHTNRTLFSNLFFFFVLVKNEPNVIKNGFIHSETFENRKKENKRSDTQTQKYATTRTKWARGGKEKQRERARQVTVKKKKNLHTKFILRTQSNQNKKCIQPQKSCALLLLFLVPRCCFLTHRSLFASLEWNENCSKMVYYVKFGVLCSRVCVCAREYHYYFGSHSHFVDMSQFDGPMCGIFSSWLFGIVALSFFFSLALWMGKVGKLSTYIVLDKHGGRFEISSFWLFHFCCECVCVCPRVFFRIWLFSIIVFLPTLIIIIITIITICYTTQIEMLSFRWMPMLDLSLDFSLSFSFLLNWLYFVSYVRTQKFFLCFCFLLGFLSFVPCWLHGSQCDVCAHHIVHSRISRSLYKYTQYI